MTVDADVWDRLADALEYPSFAPPATQERYVETFDLNPACSLDVGWHLFGDAPERGAFLSMLRDELARAGVDEHGELPDHLPALLRLIPREEDAAASALAGRIAPAVVRLRDVLLAEGNPFADVLSTAADAMSSAALEDRKLFDLARSVEQTVLRVLEEVKPGRNLRTNVEFFTALVLQALGLDPRSFVATFACGRVAGWCAHVIEQHAEDHLIRPQSEYVGPPPRGLKL